MLIVNYEQAVKTSSILKFLPGRIKKTLSFIDFDNIEEIRLRKGLPLVIYKGSSNFFITERATVTKNRQKALLVYDDDINEALSLICKNSLYTVEDSLKKGFITVDGGHRIGICGNSVTVDDKISTIKNISGLNYRIARELKGVSDKIFSNILRDKQIKNTLIISPPGCGKTTLLRDIVRKLSNSGIKVCVADERNEISALSNGTYGYDLGYSCDVLEGANKAEAMELLLRSMSPQVIATDELGCENDLKAVKKAVVSGINIIATIHSDSKESVKSTNPELMGHFKCIITLSRKNGPGTIEEIYCDN